jgi:EAL domain-containing protein (putative c-di-GMP-specific phosphodiesterase class I)/DNA-binding CsgD family transcriptional regulator/CheY-like chemotaxis protein
VTTRVLVFDDDAAVGRLAVRVATLCGMEAMAVTDATAFAQRLRVQPPQVVLLDLQLGETDGVEQLRLLAERQYGGVLVLMSGFDARVLGTARALGQSLGLKVEAVLQKPLRVAELEAVLHRVQTAGQSPSAERLLTAIANDELVLEFQPVVSRKPKVLKKLEALVRWEHPTAGRVAPAEFLPMAESNTAIIDALTDWVVGAAVDAYQVLTELGVSVPLAVNMSTLNLHDLTVPDRLEQRLRAGGMPARHLCLEITESAAFKDASLTMDILSRVRLKGMQLSIDDFGTGYSSLKMLRQMPFSEIKIDRSFVSDATTSRDSRAIVKSIMDLAANMEMGCVAEGVETEETAELLERLGSCDIQGYLIAHPMPVEAVPAWLAIWVQCGTPSRSRAREAVPELALASGEMASAGVSPEPPAADDALHLSPRQFEVMHLLCEGCSVKDIAQRLDIGVGTVKVHLSLAYSALGARNRTEAVARAQGLFEAQPAGKG